MWAEGMRHGLGAVVTADGLYYEGKIDVLCEKGFIYLLLLFDFLLHL